MIIRRILSILIDFLFLIFIILVTVLLSLLLRIESSIFISALFFALLMMCIVIEAIYWGGSSIGKKLLGLKLIDECKRVLKISDSIIRFAVLISLFSAIVIIRNALFFFFSKTFSFQIILFYCTWIFFTFFYFFPLFFSKGTYTFLDLITSKKVQYGNREIDVGTRRSVIVKSFLASMLITLLIVMFISNLNIVPRFRNHKDKSVSYSALFLNEASERSLIPVDSIDRQIRNKNKVFYSLIWKDFLLEENVLRLNLHRDISKINYKQKEGVHFIPIDYLSELSVRTPLLSMLNSNVRDFVRTTALAEVIQIMSSKKTGTKYAIRTTYESEMNVFIFSLILIYSEFLLVEFEYQENVSLTNKSQKAIQNFTCIVPDNCISFELGMITPETLLQIREF